jgi:hypothetical protein
VAYPYHLEKGDFDQALQETRRFRMLDEQPWDLYFMHHGSGSPWGKKKYPGKKTLVKIKCVV